MIKDNKALSADSMNDLQLAALARFAEEESRDKSSRIIYTVSDALYAGAMKFTMIFALDALGHENEFGIKKRGNEWVRNTGSADM